LPPEARIHAKYVDHSLTLSDKEVQSLLSGRDAGIATLNTLMGKGLMSGFSPNIRLKFATQLADALFDKSLSAQLSREAPTTLDVFQQALPPGAMRAPAPMLLERVPVGFSLTVYWR
jgi:hypothetical protein